MPSSLGPAEILVILVVALIVLGPKRLPEAGRQVGKFVSEVRHWSSAVQSEIRDVMEADEEPQPPPAAAAPPAPTAPPAPAPAPAPPGPPAADPSPVSSAEWGLGRQGSAAPPTAAPPTADLPPEWAAPGQSNGDS